MTHNLVTKNLGSLLWCHWPT